MHQQLIIVGSHNDLENSSLKAMTLFNVCTVLIPGHLRAERQACNQFGDKAAGMGLCLAAGRSMSQGTRG